jgi:NADH-quinone oxidoreductase subunit K
LIPTGHYYLFLSLAMFTIGVIGVVTRRNVIVILMSVELILNAVNINLIAFSRMWARWKGKCSRFSSSRTRRRRPRWAWAFMISFFRNKETVLGDEMDLLKW